MTALELVRLTLADYIDATAEQIVPEATLVDLGVDSLTMAELIFDLEDKHDISLPDDTARPQTVGDLVALVAPFMTQGNELAA